jgi:hypothetical protein
MNVCSSQAEKEQQGARHFFCTALCDESHSLVAVRQIMIV